MFTIETLFRRSGSGFPFSSSNLDSLSSEPYLPAALCGKFVLVLMANVFNPSVDINYKFDFKGSNVGRETLNPTNLYQSFESIVDGNDIDDPFRSLKELDFHRLLSAGLMGKLHLGIERKSFLLNQLAKDTELLKFHGFMDYRYVLMI